MRKRISVFATTSLAIALAVLMTLSCSRGHGNLTLYRVGVLTPLTGSDANYGRSTKRGADLAIEDINSRLAGQKVAFQLVYEDDQMSPTVGTNAIQKLITVDRVPVILGPFGSSVVLAVAAIANRSKTIILSASATADAISEAGDYVFRVVPPNRRQAEDVALFATQKLHAKSVSVLYLNLEYGWTLRDAFVPVFTKSGGTVRSVDSFDKDTTDFRTQLARIKGIAPDVIFVPDHYKETALILKQARELGVRGTFIGTDGACTDDMLKLAGPAAEGAYFSNMSTVDPNSADPRVRNFISAFRTKYGSDPDAYSVYAYDAMQIIAKAILEGGYSSEAIKSYFHSMPPYDGLTGPTKFDIHGGVDKRFLMYVVRNGTFQLAR